MNSRLLSAELAPLLVYFSASALSVLTTTGIDCRVNEEPVSSFQEAVELLPRNQQQHDLLKQQVGQTLKMLFLLVAATSLNPYYSCLQLRARHPETSERSRKAKRPTDDFAGVLTCAELTCADLVCYSARAVHSMEHAAVGTDVCRKLGRKQPCKCRPCSQSYCRLALEQQRPHTAVAPC